MSAPPGKSVDMNAGLKWVLPKSQPDTAETIAGELAYRDEFTIAVIDDSGRYRSWPTDRVRFTIEDPLEAHVAQLARYTDATMHDVLAYLHTLR